MASVATAIRKYLRDLDAISDLVGTRIRPDDLNQNETLPALVYRQISGTHSHNINGLDGVAVARLTFEAYAKKGSNGRATADSIIAAVTAAMDGLRGTFSGVDILSVIVDAGPEHNTEKPRDGSDNSRYVTTQDYLITHRE